jgi:predicted transcriptional regulator
MDYKPLPVNDDLDEEPEVEVREEDLPEFLAAVDRGLAQAERGEYVSGDEVLKWLASWGTDNVLPPPPTRFRPRR